MHPGIAIYMIINRSAETTKLKDILYEMEWAAVSPVCKNENKNSVSFLRF